MLVVGKCVFMCGGEINQSCDFFFMFFSLFSKFPTHCLQEYKYILNSLAYDDKYES